MRTSAKDILWPDAGYRTVHAAIRAESLGGHYAAYDAANVRSAPPGAAFRRTGGSRAGLVRLGAGVETGAAWQWPDSGAASVDWPGTDGALSLPAALRSIAAGAATLHRRENGPVEIAGDGAPENARFPCLWRGRHVCADGAQLRMSAIGDAADWSLLRCGRNAAAPVALTVALAGRGTVAQEITAIIPFRDRHLFVATADSFHCLYGDPAESRLECLDDRVGILSGDAWCFDGESVWFLSRDGLYRRAAMGERHERVSEAVAPGLLRDLEPALWHLSLTYSAWERGVYIDATLRDGSAPGIHLFAEKDSGALWPDEYAASALEPVAGAIAVFADPARHPRAALLGRDGIWRVHDAAATADDDGAAPIRSHILFGPLRGAGNAGESAFLAEVESAFASQRAPVTLAVSCADAPEALLPPAVPGAALPVRGFLASLPAPDGGGAVRHGVLRPRRRGAWHTLSLASSGAWALDALRVKSRSLGRFRP